MRCTRGVAPGEELSDPRIERTARELDQRRRAMEQASIDAPRPSFIQPAGGLLALIAVLPLVSQWELYPTELPGKNNALRALGCAIVLGLASMRLLAAQPRSPHLITGGFTLLAALALVLNGFLASHDRTSTAAAEVICGALAALVGVVALTSKDPTRS